MNKAIMNIIKPPTVKLVQKAGGKLYLDTRQATGYGFPANTPLTPLWKDLSGYGNHATPQNMAGTTASGVDTSNPLRPTWVLDGTDDFFSMVNTSIVDITTAPLAVFVTFKVATGAGNGYIVNKNLDGLANIQYSVNYDSVNSRLSCKLEYVATVYDSLTNSIQQNTWYNAGFVWNGINVKKYINISQNGTTDSFSGTLTSRPVIAIGRRNSSLQFKGNVATVTIYSGSLCTEANVLKAEKAISRAYIGG